MCSSASAERSRHRASEWCRSRPCYGGDPRARSAATTGRARTVAGWRRRGRPRPSSDALIGQWGVVVAERDCPVARLAYWRFVGVARLLSCPQGGEGRRLGRRGGVCASSPPALSAEPARDRRLGRRGACGASSPPATPAMTSTGRSQASAEPGLIRRRDLASNRTRSTTISIGPGDISMRLNMMDTVDVRRFHASRVNTPSTANANLQLMSSVCSWAIAWGVLGWDSMLSSRGLPRPPRRRLERLVGLNDELWVYVLAQPSTPSPTSMSARKCASVFSPRTPRSSSAGLAVGAACDEPLDQLLDRRMQDGLGEVAVEHRPASVEDERR